MCDTVAELAAGTEQDQWPELLPFLMQCMQSGNPLLSESVLLIFADLVNYGLQPILKEAGALHSLLTPCMAAPSLDIRIAAMKLAVALIDVRRWCYSMIITTLYDATPDVSHACTGDAQQCTA